MKVNWFSPLPPARIETADYTARLLPTLANHADITLWTGQTKWDRRLERHAQVRSFRNEPLTWSELQSGGVCVYNLGNSAEFHGGIWEISRQHPGVVILHDRNLHGLFVTAGQEHHHTKAGYFALMQHSYSLEGERAADDFARGLLAAEYMDSVYPLTHAALENALAVVVHSQPVLERLPQDHSPPAIYAPLAYAASPLQRAATPAGLPYRLIVLGHLGHRLHLDRVLKALAEFPERHAFHLDVYNQDSDSSALRAWVKELQLDRLVTVHDGVAEKKLDAALDRAHLALNLCPSGAADAASAAQLRIWDHSLPTLVTRSGWYASLPADAVAHINPEQEGAELQEHWRAFLAEPAHFAHMGERGRRLLEENHTPAAFVQTLLDFIASPRQLRLHASARSLAQRVGTEMSAWLGRDHTDDVYRSAAEQIRTLAL